MVLRFHDFYFMVFISREYLGVEVSFRYDEWHGDIGGIFMIPFPCSAAACPPAW